MKKLEQRACFGGVQEVVSHPTKLGCDMRVGVYLPPQAADRPCPVLYWLSGLTCTEQNAITKAGLQRYAAELGVIVVCPDTSPRGERIPDDPAYDLGQGAGFYVDATEAPWAANFKMATYITDELPAFIAANYPVTGAASISGHSMGGHGALVLALRNPGMYRSVSAFSPIVAPSEVPWGQKAFTAYLGADRAAWRMWDACALIESVRTPIPMLIDQGDADEFLDKQLQPERLRRFIDEVAHPIELRLQPGYDHSYYFVSTFIGEHLAWHAGYLDAS